MKEIKVGMIVDVNLFAQTVRGEVKEVWKHTVNENIFIQDKHGNDWRFYTQNNDITIIDEAVFYGMENVEIVNQSDYDFYNHAYKVSLHNYDRFWFGVYANSEQDALDTVVDYLEENGQTGYFVDLEDVMEAEEEGYFDLYLTSGNHCHNLVSEHIQIVKVK